MKDTVLLLSDSLPQAQKDRIRAAGLDVLAHEPIGAAHPLASRTDVTTLPHAGSATHATRDAVAQLAVDNLLAGLAGQPMPACYNIAQHHRG